MHNHVDRKNELFDQKCKNFYFTKLSWEIMPTTFDVHVDPKEGEYIVPENKLASCQFGLVDGGTRLETIPPPD